jgi:pyruvate kinase
MRVLLSDGTMELRVERVEGMYVSCRVIYGGTLKGSQGINIPDAVISARSVTEKDVSDLLFGLDAGVDMVAISFVQNENDVKFVRSKMAEHFHTRKWSKHLLPIISKIEVPEALRNINSILAASDAIMVARGDLGVELPSFEVPIAQKRLVMQANRAGKPVIVATQMLESMIHSAVPTRAEVSDVSNAIFDGADACMLSGETSVGKFPVLTVQMMSQIASTVAKNKEVDSSILSQDVGRSEERGENPGRAVAQAAVRMAEGLGAKAIVVPSKGGTTAHMVSACRPTMPIVALALSEDVARQLLLCYGVLPCMTDETCATMKELSALVNEAVLRSGLCVEGDKVVLTGSHPVDSKVINGTNFVKVMQVGQAEV